MGRPAAPACSSRARQTTLRRRDARPAAAMLASCLPCGIACVASVAGGGGLVTRRRGREGATYVWLRGAQRSRGAEQLVPPLLLYLCWFAWRGLGSGPSLGRWLRAHAHRASGVRFGFEVCGACHRRMCAASDALVHIASPDVRAPDVAPHPPPMAAQSAPLTAHLLHTRCGLLLSSHRLIRVAVRGAAKAGRRGAVSLCAARLTCGEVANTAQGQGRCSSHILTCCIDLLHAGPSLVEV